MAVYNNTMRVRVQEIIIEDDLPLGMKEFAMTMHQQGASQLRLVAEETFHGILETVRKLASTFNKVSIRMAAVPVHRYIPIGSMRCAETHDKKSGYVCTWIRCQTQDTVARASHARSR